MLVVSLMNIITTLVNLVLWLLFLLYGSEDDGQKETLEPLGE